MIMPKVYSVSQVNRYIHGIFEKDFILQSIWVRGEISNFKGHSSGHLYFTLKDKNSALSCIMFRGNAQMMPFELENGMEVTICGYVGVYEKMGQYQLYAELVEPTGVGALTMAFEQLKNKLMTEGLFDPDFKREIIKTPKTVAVITSPTGAAVRDIINIIKRRNKSVQIVVVPALVQGENSAYSIVQAIKDVNSWGLADTIILGRGGGSIEDLWSFNEEIVARAIFSSEIPIISAVGHETDFTIADFVADLRAPTPSAAAELAVNDAEADNGRVNALRLRLHFSMNKIIRGRKQHIGALANSGALRRPYENLIHGLMELDRHKDTIDKSFVRLFSEQKTRLFHSMERLELLSPLGVLRRGYSLSYDAKGGLIQSTAQVAVGDRIHVRVRDGQIKALVKGVEKEHGEEKTDL